MSMVLITVKKITKIKIISIGCCLCHEKEEYLITAMSGPKKGKHYLLCEICWNKYNNQCIPVPTN